MCTGAERGLEIPEPQTHLEFRVMVRLAVVWSFGLFLLPTLGCRLLLSSLSVRCGSQGLGFLDSTLGAGHNA